MTNIIGDCSPSIRRTALKKHKRKYSIHEVFHLDMLSDGKILEVSAQVGKIAYALCRLEQEKLDSAEEKSHWAVGIPTAYAICKASARLSLFPAPDQDGYTLLVSAIPDINS